MNDQSLKQQTYIHTYIHTKKIRCFGLMETFMNELREIHCSIYGQSML